MPISYGLPNLQKRETCQGPWIISNGPHAGGGKKDGHTFCTWKNFGTMGIWMWWKVTHFLIYFLFLFTSPLRCSFFSAFLATAAVISMQSRGRGWWMVSGMKPGVQDYCNLFRYDTKASSLGNHLVIQYSLLFRTSCLHLPLHIPQYYSNISSNERLLKEEHNFDLWVCFLILFDLIAPTSPFLHWCLFTLYYLDLNIYMHRHLAHRKLSHTFTPIKEPKCESFLRIVS